MLILRITLFMDTCCYIIWVPGIEIVVIEKDGVV